MTVSWPNSMTHRKIVNFITVWSSSKLSISKSCCKGFLDNKFSAQMITYTNRFRWRRRRWEWRCKMRRRRLVELDAGGLQIVVLLKVGPWRHAGSDVIVSLCWISDWSKALNLKIWTNLGCYSITVRFVGVAGLCSLLWQKKARWCDTSFWIPMFISVVWFLCCNPQY